MIDRQTRPWLFAAVIAAVAVSALSPGSPARAEPVKVRAAAHDGYGRIVFNWPTPVVYSATSEGDLLVVNFGRSIESSYAGVVRGLKSYIRDATPGADGQSVTFTLRGVFNVRSFDMGSAVVIDIVKTKDPASAAAKATGKDQAVAPTPTGKPDGSSTVGVRTGVHKGYTRIVFDWPKKVGYGLVRDGAKTVLTFDRPARINLKPLQGRPLKFVEGASQENSEDGVAVALVIPETSRIRDFRSGPKVVIDVMAPSSEPVAEKADAKPLPDKKQAAATDQPQPQKSLSQAPPQPTPPAKPVQPVTKDVAATPEPPAQGADKPVSLSPPGKLAAPTSLTPPGVTADPPGGETVAENNANVRDNTDVLDAKDETSLALLAGVKIIDPNAAKSEGQTDSASSSVMQGGDDGNSVGIRIDWDEPVAAAVFRRVGYLWVVFDKATRMDIEGLRTAAGNIIRTIEQIPNDRATVLRLTTLSGINPSLKRDGLSWILEFRQQLLQPASTIEITPQPHSPIGARLFMSVTEPGDGIVVTDPAVGDNLIVVPIIPLGYGVAIGREYPQARILPSSQGIVLKPKSDDLRVRSLRQGIEVTSSSGLKVSDIPADVAAESKLDGDAGIRKYSRLFDLGKWRQINVETFNKTKQELHRLAAAAPTSGREQARMELARFYFANDYGMEALGVLREIARDNPGIIETPEYRGISGAINTMLRRFDDAHEALDGDVIDAVDEGMFWRAVLRAYEGDVAGAAPELVRIGGVMRPYPTPLKIPLGTLIAEASILLGDIRQSTTYLETMRAINPTMAQSSKLDFIEGQLLELTGDFDGAVGRWEAVQAGPHRPSRARATIARTELLLKLEQIDLFEAIQEMEKLRFAWRGDELEFNLLRRLGEMYLGIGDYRNGLRTLRQAATHFRDYENAPEVTQEMTDAFTGLYLNNEADQLQPITAIALYDEFKELTPPGTAGDEMIRKLADRLVDVDLLDRAAGLLQAQVEFRLEGIEKARVGTQLALVHILALKYDLAIDALEKSAMKDLPEELVVQRRHLEARALMGQEQTDAALVLLNEDVSHDAELLRMEIYWNEKDWNQATKSLKRLIRESNAKPNMPVDQQQGEYLLNLAIALTLSGNEQGIVRMRIDYGPAMDETTYRDAFRLIASTQNLGLIDYSTIASKVATVENFKTFMTAYQERLKERKLSAIN